MIRKFTQCKNTKERMEMLEGTGMSDWTESELNTIMEIFGMKVPEGATKEDKWELINLSLKSKEAANNEELDRKVFSDTNEAVEPEDEEEKNVTDRAVMLNFATKNTF